MLSINLYPPATAGRVRHLTDPLEEIKRMEVDLQAIINSLDDAIVSVDDAGAVAFLNEAAAKMFGCPVSGAIGQPVARFPALAEALAQVKLSELDFSNNLPKAVRRIEGREPTGETYPLEASVTCMAANGRRLYTAVIRDVSLPQQMEKVAYEARKTQAVGALAGGIAHDFNNILTAIIS
ncbi:MAG TPA: PAS domain S-box protein, partial [Methylomirabilota bacterium]|nr:PAS domain S-box protein [Methylomirabilota bacterium]